MTEFSLDWPHGWQTRDGDKIKSLVGKTSRGDLVFEDMSGAIRARDATGKHSKISAYDIINCPAPKPEPRKLWVNVYTNMTGYVWSGEFVESREVADSRADAGQSTRIACVCITEGDGLEGE